VRWQTVKNHENKEKSNGQVSQLEIETVSHVCHMEALDVFAHKTLDYVYHGPLVDNRRLRPGFRSNQPVKISHDCDELMRAWENARVSFCL